MSNTISDYTVVRLDTPQRSLIGETSPHCNPTPFSVGAQAFVAQYPTQITTAQVVPAHPALLHPAKNRLPATAPHRVQTNPDSAGDYCAVVQKALTAISEELLTKVVLARSLHVELPHPVSHHDVHAAFCAGNPHCFVYTVQDSTGAFWVGASPELLVSKVGESLTARPLAGSRPRSTNGDLDRQARKDLEQSPKDAAEHAVVVDHITAVLNRHAAAPATTTPSTVATDSMWHLATTITAHTRSPVSSLTIAQELHPTPAVAGTPVAEALQFIDTHEPEPRGFFGGYVGWQDHHGNGEWAVAIRCLRISGTQITIPAGAGVVADSVPTAEHQETSYKFSTALAALSRVGVHIDLIQPTPVGAGRKPRMSSS